MYEYNYFNVLISSDKPLEFSGGKLRHGHIDLTMPVLQLTAEYAEEGRKLDKVEFIGGKLKASAT